MMKKGKLLFAFLITFSALFSQEKSINLRLIFIDSITNEPIKNIQFLSIMDNSGHSEFHKDIDSVFDTKLSVGYNYTFSIHPARYYFTKDVKISTLNLLTENIEQICYLKKNNETSEGQIPYIFFDSNSAKKVSDSLAYVTTLKIIKIFLIDNKHGQIGVRGCADIKEKKYKKIALERQMFVYKSLLKIGVQKEQLILMTDSGNHAFKVIGEEEDEILTESYLATLSEEQQKSKRKFNSRVEFVIIWPNSMH